MPASPSDVQSFGIHAAGRISADGTEANGFGCVMAGPFPGFYFMLLDEALPTDQSFFLVEARDPMDPSRAIASFVIDFDDDSFQDRVKGVITFDPFGGEHPDVLPADVSFTLYRSPAPSRD